MYQPKIEIKKTEILSDNWYTLKKITYDYLKQDGQWEEQAREAYDRGNGAVILLFNTEKGTVVLVRQFRMPTYINGNAHGMMIEACAGLLDEKNPADCIKREVAEETGYEIDQVTKVFEAYMSPGSVTEILHFFVARYQDSQKVSKGGGLDEEHENIEVLELPFSRALEMMYTGEIKDAKTILLLQYAQMHKLLS